MKKLIVFMFSVVMLMGCGGSDSGGGGTNPQGDVSVNGKVVHSVFSGADIVCYDRNGNKKCDTGEPSAKIAADGAYKLAGSAADALAVPIVAELANTTPGTSSLAAASSTALVFEAPAGQRIISSLSTVVKAMMDSDPTLSFDDAHAAVQTDLGTSEDLFGGSSAVEALAAEITAVLVAMFDDLATRFGITISDKVIMLVMSEIMPELTNIAGGKTPNDVVTDTTGQISTETDANDRMDDLAESMPKVMRMTDVFNNGLQAYRFMYDEGGIPANSYGFSLFDFTKSALRMYVDDDYLGALPDTTKINTENYIASKHNDGSATINGEGQQIKLASLEAIPIGGKTINANPHYAGQSVNFSTGAIMYKLINYQETALPNISRLRGGCQEVNFYCGSVALNNNTVEIRWNWSSDYNFDIIMQNNGTYEVIANNNDSYYDNDDPFSPKKTLHKGKYEKTTDNIGDIYTFKDLDGKKVFVVFKKDSYDFYFAGNFAVDLPVMLFNKTAAEDIKSQW